MTTSKVACKACRKELVYRFISDAHDPDTYVSYEVHNGKEIETVTNCPSCNAVLSDETVVFPEEPVGKKPEESTIVFKRRNIAAIEQTQLVAVQAILESAGIGGKEIQVILGNDSSRELLARAAWKAYWVAYPIEVPTLESQYDHRLRNAEYRKRVEGAIREALERCGPLSISELLVFVSARGIPENDSRSTFWSLLHEAELVRTRYGLIALPSQTKEKPIGGWY